MARKRMIDPNIWQSEDFSKLSTLSKLVFIGMFSLADDEGRGRAKPVYLKSVIFPYDDGMRVIDIEKSLSEISANMSVTLYDHDGSKYYQMDKWSKWQRVEKPQKSLIPAPQDMITGTIDDCSANVRGTVPPNKKERKIKEKENIEKKKYGEFQNVLLTDEQLDKLKGKFPNDWQKWIEKLSEGIAMKGYEYKNHYSAILSWNRRDEERDGGSQRRYKVLD